MPGPRQNERKTIPFQEESTTQDAEFPVVKDILSLLNQYRETEIAAGGSTPSPTKRSTINTLDSVISGLRKLSPTKTESQVFPILNESGHPFTDPRANETVEKIASYITQVVNARGLSLVNARSVMSSQQEGGWGVQINAVMLFESLQKGKESISIIEENLKQLAQRKISTIGQLRQTLQSLSDQGFVWRVPSRADSKGVVAADRTPADMLQAMDEVMALDPSSPDFSVSKLHEAMNKITSIFDLDLKVYFWFMKETKTTIRSFPLPPKLEKGNRLVLFLRDLNGFLLKQESL